MFLSKRHSFVFLDEELLELLEHLVSEFPQRDFADFAKPGPIAEFDSKIQRSVDTLQVLRVLLDNWDHVVDHSDNFLSGQAHVFEDHLAVEEPHGHFEVLELVFIQDRFENEAQVRLDPIDSDPAVRINQIARADHFDVGPQRHVETKLRVESPLTHKATSNVSLESLHSEPN